LTLVVLSLVAAHAESETASTITINSITNFLTRSPPFVGDYFGSI